MTQDDYNFLEAFAHCTLPKASWTHEAHLRMAWLVLERLGSIRAALDWIRPAIQRYNRSVGSQGYHETVTIAFTLLVQARRLASPISNWNDFLSRNRDLLEKEPSALATYYSPERLQTEAARLCFIPPDRAPLPMPLGFSLE